MIKLEVRKTVTPHSALRTPHLPKGFTILEVLVAGIILSMVASSLYVFVWQAFKDWNKIRMELSLYQNVSRALETVTTDLRRVPAPFFPTTPAGGTGDPIEISASTPALKPMNYVFKGDNEMKNPNPSTGTGRVGTSMLFRVNFLDQKKNPPKFLKALVRYYSIFKRVAEPTSSDPAFRYYSGAGDDTNQFVGQPTYRKLIREMCEQNPEFLSTPDRKKKFYLGYQWVSEDPETSDAAFTGMKRYVWREPQIILDNVEEFKVEFITPRTGGNFDPLGFAEPSWDFIAKTIAETAGGLPAAVRIELSAWSEGHTEDDFDQLVHQNHKLVTMRTSVMLPVWRYE